MPEVDSLALSLVGLCLMLVIYNTLSGALYTIAKRGVLVDTLAYWSISLFLTYKDIYVRI